MTLIPNPGEILFITFNVHGKKPLFRNPKACSFFLHTLRYYKPQLKFQLLGYVVMEDHIHLLMRPSPDVSISAIIQKIKGAFGRKWKMMSHWKGPVWQKSFFNTILHDDASLKHRLNQMHNHPGATGLSPSKKRYTYSSAMVYDEGIDDFLTDRITV